MTISLNGIKQFLKTNISPEKIAEVLTDIGLEVESMEYKESIKGGLKGIVIGEVLETKQHPNADKLKITKVNLGNEIKQIVCGASNIATGQKVPVATIGTEIHLSSGESFTIKVGKLRGEESHGMICAEDEIGLGTSHDGILVLNTNLPNGTALSELFPVEYDVVYEIGLTPNRADAMSHYGVARDLFAALQQRNIDATFSALAIDEKNISNQQSSFHIQIENQQQCPRYAGVYIQNVTIAESPNWLKKFLKNIDLEPINNVVDITNYVLHLYGQPLHAFDADVIESKTIVIGNLPEATEFITLDKTTRKIKSNDLLIKNGNQKPLCFAGVFGGIDSGVTHNTKNIFLESAYFNPVSVRKTAKNHGLNTDASFRFERGIDPNHTITFLKIAAQLIAEIAGGNLQENFIDLYPEKIQNHAITLRFSKIKAIIGQNINPKTVKSILQSLEIQIVSEDLEKLHIIVPAYRNDVTREVDVIEDILRIYGYNEISIPEKMSFAYDKSNNSLQKKEKGIHELLKNNGFIEILNNSLVEKTEEENTVTILNPLSNDLAMMRSSLKGGMLQSIAYNLNRKNNNLKFFESGFIYHKENHYKEQKQITIAITGDFYENNWFSSESKTSFYHLKGIVFLLLQHLGINNYEEKPLENAEGILIEKNQKAIASIYSISDRDTKRFGINQAVFYAEIYWDNCKKMNTSTNFRIHEISKSLGTRKDLSMFVPQSVSYADLYRLAFETEKKLLKKVSLFDVYEGKNLPEKQKSYALSFELHDSNKTLTDKDIEKVMNNLIKNYNEKLQTTLRS